MDFLSGKKRNRRKIFDYNTKKLENPFFNKKKKFSHFSGLKMKILAFCCLSFFIGMGWFVFASSYWRIKEISFDGLDKTSNDDILSLINNEMSGRRLVLIPNDNLLFFNEKKFLTEVANKYRFQEIKIKKQWPNKINITVKEKVLSCFWNEGDKYYLVDSEGYVLSEAQLSDLSDSKYPIISNESSERIKDKRVQVDKNYVNSAGKLFEDIRSIAGQDIIISRFIIDSDMDTIKVLTQEGVKVVFSTKESFEQQIKKFLVVKRERLKEDFKNKKYVDLRFGDKIYFQ